MKKIIFNIVAFIILVPTIHSQTLREKFLEGKNNHQEIVDAYNRLSDGEQKQLWLEKFNQLASLNLPDEHKELIDKLKVDFEDGVDVEREDFFQTASNLAKITPIKDFGYMFEKLEDYKYEGKFIDNKYFSNEFINDVKSLNPFINLDTTLNKISNCSCRWCVGMGDTHSNCKPTDHGCGFLFLQSCNQCVFCR